MIKGLLLSIALTIVPAGDAILRPLQQRDSVLIADQFAYGFRLDSLKEGTVIGLPDMKEISSDTLVLVRDWQIDTVSTRKELKKGVVNVEATTVISPFEPGTYQLPDIPVLVKVPGELPDTLLFETPEIEVKCVMFDTTFVPNDIKGQINYPVTFQEVVPYVGIVLGSLALIAGIVLLVIRLVRKKTSAGSKAAQDPPHIVALRELDRYRGEKFLAPEKQKVFYSGITDALKNYIDGRFAIDAPEMTTAEVLDALGPCTEITPELYNELKNLFETADFIKFAKMTVSKEDASGALPLAVRFVTETYQADIEKGGEE